MKKILSLLALLFVSVTFANVKIDISNKLMSVTENTIINGLDENTEEGVIFITESLRIDEGVHIKIRNACLIILGDISGTGVLDIDDSATVTLEGNKKGRITFTDRFLADSSCQQSTGLNTFKNIKAVPFGLNYSLYTLNGRLLDHGQTGEYLYNYIDPKTYFIKIEGYKTRKIVFKG